MWSLLAKFGLWLARLVAGSLAAREAHDRIEEVRREQADIAAHPDPGRDALLERMRNGSL